MDRARRPPGAAVHRPARRLSVAEASRPPVRVGCPGADLPAASRPMRATSLGHAGILIETDAGLDRLRPVVRARVLRLVVRLPPQRPAAGAGPPARSSGPTTSTSPTSTPTTSTRPSSPTTSTGAATVLLPGFPTDELERTLRGLGFERFIRTRARPAGGARRRSDGRPSTSRRRSPTAPAATRRSSSTTATVRLLNQNDCRLHDLAAADRGRPGRPPLAAVLRAPSGTRWCTTTRPSACGRWSTRRSRRSSPGPMRYVEAVGARAVVPSAGPPCFLDPELFHLNVIDGDELSIFPDQTVVPRAAGRRRHRHRPARHAGHDLRRAPPRRVTVTHPMPDDDVDAIFERQAGLPRALRGRLGAVAGRAEGDLAHARPPTCSVALQGLVGAAAGLGADAAAGRSARTCSCARATPTILVDFPGGEVRTHAGEPYAFSFDLARARWSRRWWRHGPSTGRTPCSCRAGSGPGGRGSSTSSSTTSSSRCPPSASRGPRPRPGTGWRRHREVEEIELGGYVMERCCPHRQADLCIFGEVGDGVLTCHLHGWQFDLETGRCLTADDRHLRVRPARSPAAS